MHPAPFNSSLLIPDLPSQHGVSPGLQALQDVCLQLTPVGGTFVQLSENPANRRKVQESGRFAWVRPDRLWWQYDRPETKVFVWTPERMEFYVEADCIVYYESQPQVRLQAHPLLAFVRDCDFSGLRMELRQFQAKPDEARWVFEASPTTEGDPQVPWSRVVIHWRPRALELVVQTTDWLHRRVEYRLRTDDRIRAEADQKDVWHVQFPVTCERVPLSEIGQ
ncbi:MAG: outer-membrane lipoprotein carrier protein LolA [Acidobacteria bacterium]|nr:outer-membrane lipoprotein carrier protein LolA [Acidobacteriota bacterium]MDW7983923.1 outer-membrane lipoprotein carrier protein LolA [Acidobacteriota bacterium]